MGGLVEAGGHGRRRSRRARGLIARLRPVPRGREPDGRRAARARGSAATPSLLGAVQERWLPDGLGAPGARRNIIGNQVPLGQMDGAEGEATTYGMDRRDGYVAQRRRLPGRLRDRRPANPVVVTGDVHSSRVLELKADFDDPAPESRRARTGGHTSCGSIAAWA